MIPPSDCRYDKNQLIGSGTVLWKAREMHAAGEIDDNGLSDMVTKGTPSAGHCNTMGTASTMVRDLVRASSIDDTASPCPIYLGA